MANSVDPDEMTGYAPSHLDLHCLHSLCVQVYKVERILGFLHCISVILGKWFMFAMYMDLYSTVLHNLGNSV